MAFKGFMNKTHFSIKFFQKKKKKKKESTDAKWRVSKKQVFFKKYYHPDTSYEKQTCTNVQSEKYGWWRFFKKPGGLELAFL
jgi:hypothetical protein